MDAVKKLSIITPYYNTLGYTIELGKCIIPQLNDDTEWIIVDDGCHELALDWLQSLACASEKLQNKVDIKVVHLDENSGNASLPRNIGLDIAEGKYISFIDSDDFISDDYVRMILNKIDSEDFDYCYFGWKVFDKDRDYLIESEPEKWNRCVWNGLYKRSTIGDQRFKLEKNIDEDGDFNSRVRIGKKAKENIMKVLYYYNFGRDESLIMRCKKGKIPWTK